jgi:hypothetical protein
MDERIRPNMTLKRLNSAFTARLALTVLIIAGISVLGSVGTVTAQQNNTTTTTTPTPTENQTVITEPTPTRTATPTPFQARTDFSDSTPTSTSTSTPTPIDTFTPTQTDSPGFGVSTVLIAGFAILLTTFRLYRRE